MWQILVDATIRFKIRVPHSTSGTCESNLLLFHSLHPTPSKIMGTKLLMHLLHVLLPTFLINVNREINQHLSYLSNYNVPVYIVFDLLKC